MPSEIQKNLQKHYKIGVKHNSKTGKIEITPIVIKSSSNVNPLFILQTLVCLKIMRNS